MYTLRKYICEIDDIAVCIHIRVHIKVILARIGKFH